MVVKILTEKEKVSCVQNVKQFGVQLCVFIKLPEALKPPMLCNKSPDM